MRITEVKVFPVQEEKLKAFVSIVLDECFMVNDIKIIRGKDGLFISMPSRRKKNGKFKDVAHPLNNDTRQMIEGLVLGEYDRLTGAGDEARPMAAERAPRPPDGGVPVDGGVEPAEPAPALAARAEGVERPAQKAAEEPPEKSVAEEPSLEEVTELHLRDSFWTT
jgi:stage V sporulation protein G